MIKSRSTWYNQGYAEAVEGLFDPPWEPGHRDYERYCEGHRDAQADMELEAHDDE